MRRIFHRRYQNSGEDIELYLRALYACAEDCGFKDKKERIRDQFVAGISDDELAERLEHLYLTNEKDFTLEKMVEHTRIYTDIKKGRHQEKFATDINRIKNVKNKSMKTDCTYCGTDHEYGKCPAFGKICNHCKKRNHFESVCKSKRYSEPQSRQKRDVRMLTEEEIYSDEANESKPTFLGECTVNNEEKKWIINLNVNNTPNIKFKVDTGADVCVINYKTFTSLKNMPVMMKPDKRLTCPSGNLPLVGMFKANISSKEKSVNYKIYVMKNNNKTENLLSREASVALGIVQFLGEVEINEELFGFGMWDTEQVKFTMKNNTTPYAVATARNIAIPLLKPVEKALEDMVKNGIIEKIRHPTDWVSAMVPVIKKGSKDIRICVDYKHLNQNLIREKFSIPTFEELSAKLSNATTFSKLDASSGFYQIPIHEESRDYTTFITPNGRYRFLRLPMGVNIAPEIYQRKMTEMLDDLDGVICYMDDIVVSGKSPEEHDKNLKTVLDRIISSGLKLNKDKCQFNKNQINFLGHVIGSQGIEIDPSKVEAIQSLHPPSNIHELRRILGLFNYVQKFVPKAQELASPMNELLRKNTSWHWDSKQQESFDELKKVVSNTSALAYYDPNLETTLSVDASSYGLGGVLLQRHNGNQRPVAYCSRSLSSNEKQWAQIEKECLAAAWATEKFHIFLCGLKFDLHTDHKPLVSLINTKDLTEAPIRCQRLLMRLARYSPTAIYVPGKLLVVADTLSRDPCHDTTDRDHQISDEVSYFVNNIVESLPATSIQLNRIMKCQQEDNILKDVIQFTKYGWPEEIKDIKYKDFYDARGNLSIVNSKLLLFQRRIVIPSSLQQEMLDKIHNDGHLSISKCRERVKMSIWWPTISSELNSWIEKCTFCQVNRRRQHAEPLKPTTLPERPWCKIGIDLCEFQGNKYLIIVDYYSRWIEMPKLKYTETSDVINHLKSQFSRWGIPEHIRSDGGPQFTSHQFKKFCEDFEIDHSFSDPHYPQGNGVAERAVQTAKRILKQEDPYLALLTYRSTPLAVTGCTPSQLMMGRIIRSRIPLLVEKLNPEWPDLKLVREKDSEAKQTNAKCYNRSHGAKSLPPIPTNTYVRERKNNDKQWSIPVNVNQKVGDRSYIAGGMRRNRRHLQIIPPISAQESVPSVHNPVTNNHDNSTIQANLDYGGEARTRYGRCIKPVNRYQGSL